MPAEVEGLLCFSESSTKKETFREEPRHIFCTDGRRNLQPPLPEFLRNISLEDADM